ncbi:uncharacterized protein LOC144665666 isoform X2 [Oculina patagonica]
MAASASNSMETLETKRTSKCPGCGVPASEHSWGIPSKFCEGEEKSSPRKQAPASPMIEIDDQISGLEEELASLEIEEQLQAKQRKLASLQRSIEEKRAKLQSANQQGFLPAPGIPPANITDLKQKIPETPLDGLLQPLQQAGTSSAPCWQPGVDQTMAPQGNGWQQSQLTGTSEMFLKPAQLPKGIKHSGFMCCACKQDPIFGIRWNCSDCKDSFINLCTSCYMGDEHSTDHAFKRYDASGVNGIPVEKRSATRKTQARGIYPGAKVSRGPDWEYGNHDGGTFGTVTKITNWQGNPASGADVSWESGTEGTYRLGYQGKVDLICVTAGSGGLLYKSHLPKLGPTQQILDETVQIREELTSLTLSSKADAEIQQSPTMTDDNRNTCPPSAASGVRDLMSQRVAGRVEPGSIPLSDAAGTSQDLLKASRHPLHKASINGEWNKVKMLLREGKDVDQRDKFSLTPLHLAAWYGHESVAQLLLEHGANANAVDRFQKTPLQKAERHNHQSIVQLLLRFGANPTYQQPLSLQSLSKMAFLAVDQRSGFNLLQASVYEGDYNTVLAASVYLDNFLMEMDKVSTQSNAKIFSGKTASNILFSLYKNGHANIKQLYEKHAEKAATLTELHKCSDNNDAEMAVELVLHYGTDVNITANGSRTPLLWASLRSSSVFFKTLLDLGADANFQREDQCTPLIMASYWNNCMAVRLLTETGVDPDVQCDSSDAALHVSAKKGFITISKLLIESGCNVNLQTNSGKTPLHLAVQNGHKHLVEVLLENGADVTIRNKHDPKERLFLVRGKDKGRPAWHYVMVEKPLLGLFHKRTNGGKLDVADFGTVVESGWGENPPERKIAEIVDKSIGFQKDVQGKTPLDVACEMNNENLEIIELLVKHSADIDTRDGDGFTSLQMAAIRGKIKLVLKLVELKADVNLTTMDGRDAADLAQLNEETEIEELLKLKRSSLKKLWNTLVKRL